MTAEKKNESKSENGGDAKDKKPPEHYDDAVVETHHSTIVRGETLSYIATAGRIVLKEDDDTKKASFFFTAYALDGVGDARRPRAHRPGVDRVHESHRQGRGEGVPPFREGHRSRWGLCAAIPHNV